MSNSVEMLDKLQSAVLEDNIKKESAPKYRFDKLQMYFGEDFNYKGIIISMPTIGDILKIGEEKFFRAMTPFTCNSTSIRVMLWKNGIDWNKVKDIEVFNILSNINKEQRIKENDSVNPQDLLFRNLSFENFTLVPFKQNQDDDKHELVLYDATNNILLSEEDFMIIAEYIREIFNMHPKVEKAKGKTTKQWIIQEDEMNFQQKEGKNTSTLLPLVSSCVNHPGFKYKLQELKEIGIYQFMDSVKRIHKYEIGTAALKGCYSGFIDSSKLDKELLNYMGDV